MAKKKPKFYVVWQGVSPGVYDNWQECQLQIKGVPNAKYKSFPTKREAIEAFREGHLANLQTRSSNTKKKSTPTQVDPTTHPNIIEHSLSVDAACSGSPGIMEYRGTWTHNAEQVFHQGPFPRGTNNIGEFLALVHGIAYLQKIGKPKMPIYSDSKTALAWLRNKKTKTTLKREARTEKLFQLMERATYWLQNNTYQNPIYKWETEKWGEIPADFGRK